MVGGFFPCLVSVPPVHSHHSVRALQNRLFSYQTETCSISSHIAEAVQKKGTQCQLSKTFLFLWFFHVMLVTFNRFVTASSDHLAVVVVEVSDVINVADVSNVQRHRRC